MSHQVYIKGIEEIVNKLTKTVPEKITKHMQTATKNAGEVLRKAIVDKIGPSHQHPAGVPSPGLGLGEETDWYPPSARRKEFGHEYLEGAPIPVKASPEDYDFDIPVPTEHYWPFRRLGDLVGSLSIQETATGGNAFARAVFMVSQVPDDLETREAGRYSFVIPSIFESYNTMREQFVRGMMDFLNETL
jgi:hypothetical protein